MCEKNNYCIFSIFRGWDRKWKSNRIRAWFDDPNGIAKEWLKITLSDAKLSYAEFD
jgi:hypothetical protein